VRPGRRVIEHEDRQHPPARRDRGGEGSVVREAKVVPEPDQDGCGHDFIM